MFNHSFISSQSTTVSPSPVKEILPVQEQLQSETGKELSQSLLIQCKLSIGSPDDPLEKEADAMADTIMRMPEQSFIQRKCSHCEEEEKLQRKPLASFIQRKESSYGAVASDTITNQINSSRGSGSSMDSSTQSFMQSRFGTDFTDVKIHTGHESVQMNRELSAKAFTVGSDIYFNDGQYNPNSTEGKHLLAHELTHTVQQGGAIERKVQRTVSPAIDTIISHLSYGIVDWAITNGDVRAVLNLLKDLNDTDLADTVTRMGNSLINRLVENLAESDDRNLEWVTRLIQRIQRARQTIPDISTLQSLLSYGFFDWEITDSDVFAVLLYLKDLTNDQLRPIVATLEAGGFITRLYENLAEADDHNRGWIERLMDRIQTMRVHRRDDGTEYTGSCTPEQQEKTSGRLPTVVNWATQFTDTLFRFSLGMGDIPRIAALLDKYFFNEARTGTLTDNQREQFTREIINKVERMKTGAANTPINCASPFDSSCTIFSAYVSGSTMRMCARYFRRNDNMQTVILFHELMHFYNEEVDDTGYEYERVFEYLPPDRSVRNADSYSAFVTELVLGSDHATVRTARDSVEGCTAGHESNLRRDIAFATRMIANSSNEITSSSFNVQNRGNVATTNFKATEHDQLIRFSERITGLYVPNRVGFHCDPNAGSTLGLPFTEGEGLHLTPAYFGISDDNDRVLRLLAILFAKYVSGMNTAVLPSGAGFGSQNIDQAYQNPGAFAGYARDISLQGGNRDEWDFADAIVRYDEELGRSVSAVTDDFRHRYDERFFKTLILDHVIEELESWASLELLTNHSRLESRVTTLRQKAAIVSTFLDRMYNDYNRLYLDNFFEGLLMFNGTLFSSARLYLVLDLKHRNAMQAIRSSFEPHLQRVISGQSVRFEDWSDYQALFDAYRTDTRQTLDIMRTYNNYIEQLHAIKSQFNTFSDPIEQSPAVMDLPFDDFAFVLTEGSNINREIDQVVAEGDMYVRAAIREGRIFNRRDPDLPDPVQLLRQFRQRFQRTVREAARTHH